MASEGEEPPSEFDGHTSRLRRQRWSENQAREEDSDPRAIRAAFEEELMKALQQQNDKQKEELMKALQQQNDNIKTLTGGSRDERRQAPGFKKDPRFGTGGFSGTMYKAIGGGAYQVGDKIDFDKCTHVVREITPSGKVMVMYKNKLMTVEQVESLLQKKESVKRKK
eukprot:gene19800-26483_t